MAEVRTSHRTGALTASIACPLFCFSSGAGFSLHGVLSLGKGAVVCALERCRWVPLPNVGRARFGVWVLLPLGCSCKVLLWSLDAGAAVGAAVQCVV